MKLFHELEVEWADLADSLFFILFLKFFWQRFYLFIHERHREAETQAEGEGGSLWGA